MYESSKELANQINEKDLNNMAGGKKIPIPPEKPKIKPEPSYKPEDDIGSTYMKCYSGRCIVHDG